MKIVHIKEKLNEIGISLDEIVLGDFDFIGRFTAERQRDKNDPNYSKYGWHYRANLERGINVYYLIKQFELSSVLEIGYGRGFFTYCCAKAFHDFGIEGTITTVDPELKEEAVKQLQQFFPQEWFKYIKFFQGSSQEVVPTLNEKFDLVYIDGAHDYVSTKTDWENTRTKFNNFLIFDDYHMSSKNDPGIQVSKLVDEIDWKTEGCLEPEMIRMDRRIFFDDRRFEDEQIDYGQVLFTKIGTTLKENTW